MWTHDRAAIRAAFRALHQDGYFVLPNPWDIGGVRRLERLGFKALASTSAGYAWSLGREDGELSRDDVLDHLRTLCSATDLPINADFEAGFADHAADVAANVALAVETGVAGLSIEDRSGDQLYGLAQAVERIAAARSAIDATGHDVLLVARTEGMLIGGTLPEARERLRAFAAAGADVLYAPGVTEPADIKALVEAVAPKPLNVLLRTASMNVAELATLGVRRFSVGAAFARAAWAGFEAAALAVRDAGHLPELTHR